MKLRFFVVTIACAFVLSTQCSLTDRLAKASNQTATIRKDIASGKIEVTNKCNSTGGCSAQS